MLRRRATSGRAAVTASAILALVAVVAVLDATAMGAPADTRPAPPKEVSREGAPRLVYFDEPESAALFAAAKAKAPFWPLVRAFESEAMETYCAVASAVMVLNALRLPSPPEPLVWPYHKFDQRNVFDDAALRIIPAPAVAADGMTLDQLAAVLRVHGLAVTVHHAGETTVEAFRAAVREATAASDRYLVVNLLRAAVGQAGPGHFSPVAAYEEKSDRLLVMDVARYKYAPWWIETPALFTAMNTEDPSAGKTRGFLVVTRK
jgi:hypothetical protein